MRDYHLGTTFDVKFTTRSFSTGAPTAFDASPTPQIVAYADNSTTEIGTGITLTIDFDGKTGLHNIRVVATSGNGFAAGSNYALVIADGFVGGVSVANEVVAEFSLEAQSALRPTVAGRTLDVDTDGAAEGNVTKFGGTAGTFSGGRPEIIIQDDGITAAKIAANAITSTEIADGAFTAAKFASGAFDAVWTVTTRTLSAGAIVAATIADNAFTAAKFASGAFDAVWSVATRLLTAGTNIVLAKGVGVTGFNDLSAADVRSAVGLAAANLDTQLAALATMIGDVPTAGENADAVWDEVLTAATHNVASSAGRRLRQVSADFMHSGTAAGGSNNTITLDNGASSTNGTYDPGLITIIEGTGAGQARAIIDYVGSTRVATVDRDWRTNPDATSVFFIQGISTPSHVHEGVAAAGAASTITLGQDAKTTDDIYNGQTIFIKSGTGQDQARVITDYVGSTKVATVSPAWAITPDTTSGYIVVPVLTDPNVLINIAALNNLSSAQAQAAAAAALTAYDPPTNAEMEARTLAAASYGTAAQSTAIEADTQDIQSRLPAALVSGRMNSDTRAVNGVAVTGAGTAGNTWGP